jgi:predicted anti-sigma-YlaC factor YlaD
MKWMLTCEQVVSKTSAFVDRDMSWTERLRMRVHLAMCRVCREYVRQVALVVGALRILPPQLPGEARRKRLMRLFRTA